jgi:peptidoglycan hydrolase CwlO-like protein
MTKIQVNLNEQIQNEQTLLEALQTERDDFQNRMTAAVGAGDSAVMIDLRRRQSEVPIEITTAQIRLAKLQLESDEARLPLLQAEVRKFTEPIETAVLKRDAAVLELNKLQGEYHTANEDFRDLRIRIGERSRELARLIHMSNPAREILSTRLRSLNAS